MKRFGRAFPRVLAIAGLSTLFLLACSRSDASKPAEAENSSREDDAARAASPAGPGPNKLALVIGIDKYGHPEAVSPLNGSVNDAEDIKALLIGKFEFPPQNILVLKNEQATHAGIINAIRTHLIAKAQKDDIVVLHYSGHGSQMKDVTGKRPSGLDETIVPYDSRDPAGKVFDISGAELHGLLLQLAAKTKNLTFILDSCHSGTLFRDPNVAARVRGIPTDTRTPPASVPEYAAVGERGLGQPAGDRPLEYAFIAATTSRESAFEHFGDGKEHGALTYFLVRQLRHSGAGATYRDVMDNVMGNVTANYPAQHPQLEGTAADQFVFGDRSSLAQSYVLASLGDGGKVILSAGEANGATVGSAYDVYPPGTKAFGANAKAIARIQIVSIEPFRSDAKLLSGAKIPDFSRAVERQHRYGSRRMRIYFDGLNASAKLQAVKDGLGGLPVEPVEERAWCHMQIRERNGRIETLAADSTTLSTPVSVNAPDLVDRLRGQVRGWARWFNALSVSNAQPDLPVRFSIKASQTRDPFARLGKPDAGVFAGETIDATIDNASDREVYFAMLDLSSDGSISVVYPDVQGSSAVLKPGLKFTKSFNTFVPKGRSVVTDVLKVFVSTRPVDLTPLIQGAVREERPDDPLADLLEYAGGVGRGVSAVQSKPVYLGGWNTAQRVLVVKEKKR